jgi:hypothetical protein
MPALQMAMEFAGARQAAPHLPQCWTLLFRSTSHPFVTFASQSAKPMLQLSPHIPAAHTALAFAPPRQRLVQRPQCSVERFRSTLHPLRGFPSQSPKPELQERRQVPAEHIAVVLSPVAMASERFDPASSTSTD